MNGQRAAPLGFVEVTVGASAVGITTGTIPADANFALLIPEGAMRFRDDGISPTPTSGLLIGPTTGVASLQYTGDLDAFRAISVSGTVALGVSLYLLAG